MATLSSTVSTTESTMLDDQPENVSNKVLSVTTPNEPLSLPNKNIWLWVKQAMYRNGLEAEKMAGKRRVTNFFFRKSENVYKE